MTNASDRPEGDEVIRGTITELAAHQAKALRALADDHDDPERAAVCRDGAQMIEDLTRLLESSRAAAARLRKERSAKS